MSASLTSSLDGRVLRITLNRPEKRNALSFELCGGLVDALEHAESDPQVRAVLLSAAGGVFSAGMDLEEAVAPEAATHAAIHEELFTIGARISVPVVAAVSGPALGGGLGVVANAHIVVAAQGSSFGLTEIRVGMWPFVVFRAVSLALGERRALELAITGRIFGAEEALAWGLAQYVVPALEAEQRASAIAAAIANSPADTIRRGMRFVHQARGLSWANAGRLAADARRVVFEGAAFREGVAAFREKRKPRWG